MYQFCVSGAAKGQSVEEAKDLARAVGVALAERGHSLLTGATTGLPNYAAEAYKAAGGQMSLGISPAASKIEHVMKYRLPTEAYDVILYSGLHYVGRDTLLINSSDAVVSVGGRLGTLHEFTIAMETNTPIGMLEDSGGIGREIHDILEAAGRRNDPELTFSKDPVALVEQLEAIMDEQMHKYYVSRTRRNLARAAAKQEAAS
ncbi:hypothetical protein CR970_00880 [Candidatus Saccharibacteria bacterium]|nr:MAG: hypothetical protein CR970_00880 [Candidatus Saccharibacteria bacterium]